MHVLHEVPLVHDLMHTIAIEQALVVYFVVFLCYDMRVDCFNDYFRRYNIMPLDQTKLLCESTKMQLNHAIQILEGFLNNHSLPSLYTDQDAAMVDFYKGFLTDLRHLLVFSEIYYEKLGVSLRRPIFNEETAGKVLYETYHRCINLFYYPKNECYSEEGRYAYTGQDAIRFRKKPVRAVRDITMEISKIYEQLREDLSYYENDYVNQRRLQGEKV